MDQEDIARRIAALSEEHRAALYHLCAMRKRKNKRGSSVPVYEPVDPDVALALKDQELVWLLGTTMAAATEHVYEYWLKYIDPLETEAAD